MKPAQTKPNHSDMSNNDQFVAGKIIDTRTKVKKKTLFTHAKPKIYYPIF